MIADSAIHPVEAAAYVPAPATCAAVSVRGVSVSYRHLPALRHVSADVPRGDLLAVVGPNGAGKSTLLKAILGLVRLDAGEVLILGQPAAQMRMQVAYVPQTESVDWDFPITVAEVALMGRYGRLGWFGRPRAADHALVRESLDTVGMADFASRHIRELSGGQQQRVFLARALVQQAPILLLDEPFAGVDARTEAAILDLMQQFAAQGKTLIVVNHNLQILDRFASVLLLNQIVITQGPPAEALTDANLRRTYGGRMSFVAEAERQLREGPPDVR